MKSNPILLRPLVGGAILLMAFGGLLHAAIPLPSSAAPRPDEEALHQELRQLGGTYENAVNSGDLSSLSPLFAPETSGVLSLGEQFHNLSEMQTIFDNFKKFLGPNYVYRIHLNPERSLIYGNIAVARGTSDEYIKNSRGKEFHLTSFWTAVLNRENGQWHLLRSQVSIPAFRNEAFDAMVRATGRLYGAGGFVLGLIVGLGAGVLFVRRGCRRAT